MSIPRATSSKVQGPNTQGAPAFSTSRHLSRNKRTHLFVPVFHTHLQVCLYERAAVSATLLIVIIRLVPAADYFCRALQLSINNTLLLLRTSRVLCFPFPQKIVKLIQAFVGMTALLAAFPPCLGQEDVKETAATHPLLTGSVCRVRDSHDHLGVSGECRLPTPSSMENNIISVSTFGLDYRNKNRSHEILKFKHAPNRGVRFQVGAIVSGVFCGGWAVGGGPDAGASKRML